MLVGDGEEVALDFGLRVVCFGSMVEVTCFMIFRKCWVLSALLDTAVVALLGHAMMFTMECDRHGTVAVL